MKETRDNKWVTPLSQGKLLALGEWLSRGSYTVMQNVLPRSHDENQLEDNARMPGVQGHGHRKEEAGLDSRKM